jgi:pimeloyl-ACP methyl ester carboxylesterase
LGDVAYVHDLTLDAYAPPGEPRPAAVIIHSSRGNKRTHVTQLFDVLDRAGYAWFSVDYRTGADVAEAVRYVRCPGRFNITNQLVLIGVDTGAQIALDLAAQDEFHGVVTMGAKLSQGALSETRGRLADGATPVLMFHGTDDDEYPASQAEAVCRQLPKCSFHAEPNAIHDFENWHPDQWSWKT